MLTNLTVGAAGGAGVCTPSEHCGGDGVGAVLPEHRSGGGRGSVRCHHEQPAPALQHPRRRHRFHQEPP